MCVGVEMNCNVNPALTTSCLVVLMVVLCGCRSQQIESGLEVSKVPLSARLANRDGGINGFRYYLTRPYVTVSRRLEVSTTYDVCEEENGKLKSLTTGNSYALSADSGVFIKPIPPTVQTSYRRQQEGESNQDSLESIEEIAGNIDDRTTQILTGVNAIVENTKGSQTATGTTSGISGEITVNVFQKTESKSGAVASAIQIVYLPDFEEQLAINHKNRLSSSKFALNFKNGTELSNVAGSFNSAEVPIKIAQTISTAIESAAAVASKALTTLPVSLEGALEKREVRQNSDSPLVLVAKTTFIEPGIYRLQKQSEMNVDASKGQGFLTELGLPMQTDTQVYLLEDKEE